MTREEKVNEISNLSKKFKQNKSFYFTDASGFTVAEINDFRRKCFENDIEHKVAKNTLIKKALESIDDVDFSVLDDVLIGFSSVMFSEENASLPAKLIEEFKKKDKNNRPILKAASIEFNLFIGEEHLNTLSKLKSKDELIGDIIGLLQSPVNNVISSLKSGEQIIADLVKNLSER